MGNYFLLSNNNDDNFSDTSNAALQEQAKLLHEFDQQQSAKPDHLNMQQVTKINDIPLQLSRKRSESMPKKRISSLQRYKRNKSRQLRSTRSLEETLATREVQVRQQKQAIKILRKQNEYLRQQNEKFIGQYGSYFAPTNSTNNKQTIESLKIYVSPDPIPTNSQITENVDTSSPLTPLTSTQTNIILSF